MEFKHIRKPDLRRIQASTLYKRYHANRRAMLDYMQRVTYPSYLPWEKARFITPPEGFTPEEAWILAKDMRSASAQPLVVKTPEGENFYWSRLNYTDRLLNRFDLYMGGRF